MDLKKVENDEEVFLNPEVNKIIGLDSMPMELTVLELPLFQFTYAKKKDLYTFDIPVTDEEIEAEEKELTLFDSNLENNSESVEEEGSITLLRDMDKQFRDERMELFGEEFIEKDGRKYKRVVMERKRFTWVDSRNFKRGLQIESVGRLPRGSEMDVFFGLIKLYVSKYGPFVYDSDKKRFELKQKTLEFSFYELAQCMRLKPSGQTYKRFRNAIRILKKTQYQSLMQGVIYNKEKNEYLSEETTVSLIDYYRFRTHKRVKGAKLDKDKDINTVAFGQLILSNIENGYFKFIDNSIFFELPSGLCRSLYGYLEKNRNDKTYLKRSYDVLTIKVPIEYDYPYQIKVKLKNACEILIKQNYIKDYIFCDEVAIDGETSDDIIFCFKCTKEEAIRDIETRARKRKDSQANKLVAADLEDDRPYLVLPKGNIIEELVARGINEATAIDITRGMDKWEVIKYIIWIDKYEMLGNINSNKGGLLAAALRGAKDKRSEYKISDQEILDFVALKKSKAEKSYEDIEKRLRNAYNCYVDREIEKIKKENPLLYQSNFDNIINGAERMVQNVKSSPYTSEKLVAEAKDFEANRENSEWFKRILRQEIVVVLRLKDFEAFKVQIYNGNIKLEDFE